jgi:hypothetical protein
LRREGQAVSRAVCGGGHMCGVTGVELARVETWEGKARAWESGEASLSAGTRHVVANRADTRSVRWREVMGDLEVETGRGLAVLRATQQ